MYALSILYEQRERLRNLTLSNLSNPRRWMGSLRRNSLARAIRSSNSIEGYHATADQAVAVVADEAPPQEGYSDTWRAIKGYRDALTYIMQAVADPHFELTKQFLKSLHFMMVGHEMTKYPGQWRPGSIFVINTQNGETVYEAPDVAQVDALAEEFIASLKEKDDNTSFVRGAMAHLNLTMIHPFKDGNGRMARALQTFEIARDGLVHPVFSSIEEWLGEHTQEYYQVLAQVGRGAWNPQNSALPWVRFCLEAHYEQQATFLRRIDEYGRLFEEIANLISSRKLPARCEMPLFDACTGIQLTNSRYRAETEVSEYVASRDLKKLSEMGLLEPAGEARGRSYSASPELQQIRLKTRITRRSDDKLYVHAEKNLREHGSPSQLRLPGV